MSGVTSLNGITGVVACVSQNTGALGISGAGQNVVFQPLAGGVTEITAGGQVSSGAMTFVNGTGVTITNDGFNNLTFTGSGGGGNWSYKGVFVPTTGTAYALNDVVFDTVNTAQTYVCILAYTTPGVPVPPSNDATHWKLFATNTSSSSGGVSGLLAGVGGTPSTGAVPIVAGSGISVTGSGGADASVTIANTLTPTSAVVGAGTPATGPLTFAGSVVQSGSTFTFTGGSAGGGNWSYRGVFVATAGTAYAINDVVFDTVNTTQTYVCILAYTTGASASAPSVNATNWLLFANNTTPTVPTALVNGPNSLSVSGSVGGPTTYVGGTFLLQSNPASGQPPATTLRRIDPTAGAIDSTLTQRYNPDATNPSLCLTQNIFDNPTTTNLRTNDNPIATYGGLWAVGTGLNPNAYTTGTIVQSPVNSQYYVCILGVTNNNRDPSIDTTHWTSIGGGIPSSIVSPNGNNVACLDNGIDLTTTANAGDGTVIVNALAGAIGNVVLQSGVAGDVGVASGLSGGIALVSADTQILMGGNVLGQPVTGGTDFPNGVSGSISLYATGTTAGTLTVGGTQVNTGLYVSDTALTFNGSAVGGGGGNWSYKGVFVATSGTAYALNDVVFDTVNTTQSYVCILAYTTGAGASAPSADATHWRLFATNSATANATSISQAGGSVAINSTGAVDAQSPTGDVSIWAGTTKPPPPMTGTNNIFIETGSPFPTGSAPSLNKAIFISADYPATSEGSVAIFGGQIGLQGYTVDIGTSTPASIPSVGGQTLNAHADIGNVSIYTGTGNLPPIPANSTNNILITTRAGPVAFTTPPTIDIVNGGAELQLFQDSAVLTSTAQPFRVSSSGIEIVSNGSTSSVQTIASANTGGLLLTSATTATPATIPPVGLFITATALYFNGVQITVP